MKGSTFFGKKVPISSPLPLRLNTSPLEQKEKETKTMTQKDFDEGNVEGFMHPPYRKPRDLAGNVKYHHGYRWKNKKTEKKKNK